MGFLVVPSCYQFIFQRCVFVDVEIARVFVLRIDGRERIERGALEERDLDIAREAMEAQEPALALDPVEGRVPSDRLQRIGTGARDQRVEAAPGLAFPETGRASARERECQYG